MITTFYLRVSIIEYNGEAKINLINELLKNDYFFLIKKWQCIRHMKVTGKTLHFDITNISRNVDNPVWTFVVFQTNRDNSQPKDNDVFDHKNVLNLSMEIDGKRYPEESWDLDWDNNYCLAYNAFQELKKKESALKQT